MVLCLSVLWPPIRVLLTTCGLWGWWQSVPHSRPQIRSGQASLHPLESWMSLLSLLDDLFMSHSEGVSEFSKNALKSWVCLTLG